MLITCSPESHYDKKPFNMYTGANDLNYRMQIDNTFELLAHH